MEYIIYADESKERGQFFSNFYGGALVRSPDYRGVVEVLEQAKRDQNLFGEVKWGKITKVYAPKYEALMDAFFELVGADLVKVRIMFTQNVNVPAGLVREQVENRYSLLYYQMLKHHFGLQYAPHGPATVRILLDKMPLNDEQTAGFKSHLANLSTNPEFRRAGLRLPLQNIGEIHSHDHVLLQCLDVVLGSIQFRLNDKHLEKPPGARRRGGRTLGKERVYKRINRHIREIYPGFNIGISTGTKDDKGNRWRHPYRHWLFVPRQRRYDSDPALTKNR